MLPQPDRSRLVDMLHYAHRAVAFVDGVDEKTFLDGDIRLFATTRCIEVIGEAAARVDPTTRKQFPKLPWIYMAPMRQVCKNEYGRVDPIRIWQTVRYSLPDLIDQLERILAEHPD